VPLDHGGTGATTALGARANLALGQLATKSLTTHIRAENSSARPVAEVRGRLSFGRDTSDIAFDNGSAWDTYGPVYSLAAPAAADFTWVNQGTAVASDQPHGLYVRIPGSAALNARMLTKLVPPTPYTITVRFMAQGFPSGDWAGGVGWRESSSGKIVAMSVGHNGTIGSLRIQRFADNATFSSLALERTSRGFIAGPTFFRFVNDGTTRRFLYSYDGVSFTELANEGQSNFLTPDEIGVFATNSNSKSVHMTVSNWVEE
jgi:hypothetical protein